MNNMLKNEAALFFAGSSDLNGPEHAGTQASGVDTGHKDSFFEFLLLETVESFF